MSFNRLLKAFRGDSKISVHFRNINITMFAIVSALILAVMFFVLKNISETVSLDYARLYSANTVGALGTYLDGEIALVTKAARSNAVMDWFADEGNREKKLDAYSEMMGIISVLKSKNLYIGIDKTLHEFTVQEGYGVDDINWYATLAPSNNNDAWYFECTSSDKDYQFNVDIDKIMNRKLVWLNYKVQRDGEVLGVICAGLELSRLVEKLFSEYDNTKVRGLVIDESGIIHMDSEFLGNNEFLHYRAENTIDAEFSDAVLLTAISEHLAGIDGYFESVGELSVIKLSEGPYSYATIAPIEATTWSVVTLYNASSLFNLFELLPLFLIMLAMFVIFTVVTNFTTKKLIFEPFENLMSSIAKLKENKNERVYGAERKDEFGNLANTIQSMKDRLDSYNTDLEREVAERSADLKEAYEKVKTQNQTILSSIDYASRIQKHLLPLEAVFRNAFLDYSVLWKPRDVVGGDIYWLKKFEGGTLLCVCDCTGHGTPGALLTMLVVSAFETSINEENYKDTAEIIWMLENRLVNVFQIHSMPESRRGLSDINDGCDLAVLFIANDGSVDISAGNMRVFICDGSSVTRIKGQKLHIGEGNLTSKEEVKVVQIPANPENKFYIASDGLFDQIGGISELPFGYKHFSSLILENHSERQEIISKRIWEAFENHRSGQLRRDDIELITFKPKISDNIEG